MTKGFIKPLFKRTFNCDKVRRFTRHRRTSLPNQAGFAGLGVTIAEIGK